MCIQYRFVQRTYHGQKLKYIFGWIVGCYIICPYLPVNQKGSPIKWDPTSYKWSYNPYKWPSKWATGVITLVIGIINPFITGRGPPCRVK